MLPKDVRCYFALAKQLLAEVDFSALSQETRTQYSELAKEAISEVLEARPNARISTIVTKVIGLIRDEVEEILVLDADRKAVADLVERALNKFVGDSGLYGADGHVGDAIVSLVEEHLEEVARDWYLDATTSPAVVDALIEEATCRADDGIEELLAEIDHGDQAEQENDYE